MTNAKHTPGPWGVEKMGDDFNITFSEQGNWLATVFYDDDPVVGRPEADARLIAAAPELLEALKAIVPVVVNRILEPSSDQSLKDMILGAYDAIAKAEGR